MHLTDREDYVEWYASVSTGPILPPHMRIGSVLHLRIDRSRVELALLPRLSLTRLSRTQSLRRIVRSSLSCYYPQGAQQPTVHIII